MTTEKGNYVVMRFYDDKTIEPSYMFLHSCGFPAFTSDKNYAKRYKRIGDAKNRIKRMKKTHWVQDDLRAIFLEN